MDFLPEKLTEYVEAHTTPESELLQQLNRETHLKVMMPRMLSGHLQGRVLAMLSHMIKPKRVLEIGTYTGYSALCLAEGMDESGELITIDVNEELTDMVSSYFADADIRCSIHQLVGNALEIIPNLEGPFDLVFIDADKENYCRYFDMVIDKLSIGGYIIADNVLWSGKVIEPVKANDADTQGIMAYNEKVHADSRVENVLFPIRDGLMVCRKC